LWRRWLECHDISAATQLARIHRQLLVERVKSYTVPRRLSEAFIAEGHIGLIRAICRFDPDGTEDFPAFAIRHVDAALRDYAEFLLGERVRRPSLVSESTGRRIPIS
jgi:DNA-directed RNA polymerase specialized sigma subunit